MPLKKILAAFLIIAVAIGGFAAGLVLLKQRQELGQKAAVPGGQATVSFNPATGNYKVGDTITTNVYFNSAGIPISGVAVRISYPFNGATPEVTAASIDVNPSLLSSGDWSCPTQNSSVQGNNVIIDIGCPNVSAAGFISSQNTLLATISLKINRVPEISPLVLRFDSNESVITRRSDNEDILLIPTSTGEYTIEGSVTPTNSPTPTKKISGTPSVTKTPTVTKAVTGSVTGTKTLTPTPAQLPNAGFSMPTILGAGLGILTIAAALLLAL